MKQNLLVIIFFFLFSSIFAQSQFENASFEQWDDAGTPFEEPTEWSSIKTGDHSASTASPKVIEMSTDAHTGNYSIHLINKYVGLIDFVSPGTFTNGRIHIAPDLDPYESTSFTDTSNAQWNTPLIYRPDSLVGWYKAKAMGDDFPTAKVILHADSNSIPGDSLKWIARAYWKGEPGATVNEWTRFSTPFEYFSDENPEYILATITSGDSYYAVDEGEAWFDDLELIYNGSSVGELLAENLEVIYMQNLLQVQLNTNDKYSAQLAVFDIGGRLLLSDKLNASSLNQYRIDLKKGVYIVKIQAGKESISRKFQVN